jgi:large conductance mechanosensitive channel
MVSLLTEFEKFALRGNIIDLAVGVIIGVAFNKIVSSLVDGIIMPVLGLLMGGINIAGKTFTLGDTAVKWGDFLQNLLNFVIIAFTIFMVLKLINSIHHKHNPPNPPPTQQEVLLREIRDLLKAKSNQ